ncbi:MAG: hypothetical protein KDA81_12025 [Planctomycetaceae bacterium]|nr:hypothetical protein [Planctomycetaceae bacterium]
MNRHKEWESGNTTDIPQIVGRMFRRARFVNVRQKLPLHVRCCLLSLLPNLSGSLHNLPDHPAGVRTTIGHRCHTA